MQIARYDLWLLYPVSNNTALEPPPVVAKVLTPAILQRKTPEPSNQLAGVCVGTSIQASLVEQEK